MEFARTVHPRSNIIPRYRRRGQILASANDRKEEEIREEESRTRADSDSQSLPQKEKQKKSELQPSTMTKEHRMFHRRQALPTQIVTVNVEIIATVDSSGNVVGHETRTQADPAVPTPGVVAGSPVPVPAPVPAPAANAIDPVPAPIAAPAAAPAASAPGVAINAIPPGVPSVPAVPVPAVPSLPQVPAVPPMPTVALPAVPAVPSFPQSLTVPAYPWPSGVSAQVAQVSAPPVTSAVQKSASASSASHLSAAPIPASNSTSINTASGLSTLDSISGSLSNSVSMSASGLSSSDSDNTASSKRTSTTAVSTGTWANGGGVGGGQPHNTGIPPAQGTAAAGTGPTGNSPALETPRVVGSVVGSLAGAALILALVLLLLRRHKRKRQGQLQLTNDETADRAQPMAQRASWGNRIPSTFLNRFSGMSRSTAETSTSGGERSFQRVSGRKLPSAFSEGMTSEQFSRGGTMSGSSFYQDDHGTYGGPGISKEFGKEIGMTQATGVGAMNIRPSPARTPVIRHPDEDVNPFADPAPFPKARSHLSPPQSPNPDAPRGTLGRSLHSQDGSRSSKFTENV